MRQRAPIFLLAFAVVSSGALLVSYASGLTFVGDSWEVLAGRPDWSAGTFLEPFNEHAILLLALVFKALLAVFGMDSALPFHVVSIFLFLLGTLAMFAYMRRRVGDWLALSGTLLLLFMGAAYEDLLWEFQMCFFGSIAAGVGSFLALDREDRIGDWTASILLVVATAFSSLGVPFILAAAVRTGLDPSTRWRRAYVSALPLVLYAIWWLTSGHSAGSEVGLADLPEMPRYVFDAAAAGIASLLGRQPIGEGGHPPAPAQLLAVLLGVGLIYRFGRRRHLPPGLIVALVLTFSFWGLLALDRGPQRFSSRFQYPSGVFLLIVAAEALRDYKLPRPALFAVGAITAVAVAGGVSLLADGYASSWKGTSNTIQATLAAVDIAGADADPQYEIDLPPSIFLPIAQYREARRLHGTPALSEAELHDAEESELHRADRVLATVLGLSLSAPASRQLPDCRELGPESKRATATQLPPDSRLQLENRGRGAAEVKVGRFSPDLPVHLGLLPAGESAAIRLPAGRSGRPWKLGIDGGPVRLCPIR